MAAAATGVLQAVAVGLYSVGQALLVVYSSHRYLILWRWWRHRPARGGVRAIPDADLPVVTVQLPIYNERRVVDRLIDAVAALDYPAGKLEIQVLDDSTDDTRERAAAAVERYRRQGVDIHYLHRTRREGFKAGALAEGLGKARGEWIAVFDADFVPRPNFLRQISLHFGDPGVGMVQGRWGHLNRGASLLTAAQAVMLDSHFLLEHEVRMNRGLFFNFNGTAGVWRRTCIEDAGGWSHDTLTEDLDLSYRAQLKGWRFVFDASVDAPAELPADIEALKSQQRRWAKGSIQTARKVLPELLRSRLPLAVKLEAIVHLTGNASYPLLVALALLLLPVLVARTSVPPGIVWSVQIFVIGLGLLPVSLFLGVGQILAGCRRTALRDVLAALVLSVGLSINNSRAVLEGLGRGIGDWERTPKAGSAGAALPGYRATRGVTGRTELVLALYFVALGIIASEAGRYRAIPFLLLLVAGFGAVGLASLRSSLASMRARA